RFPFCLFTKGEQRQSRGKRERRERDWRADRVEMLDAGADEKRDASAGESSDRRGERESARAAIGGVLLWQPQGVHREIAAADAEHKEHEHERRQRMRQIEHVAEAKRDRHEHDREVNAEREPPAVAVREYRQNKASGDRSA